MVDSIDKPSDFIHRIPHAAFGLSCHGEPGLGILEPSDSNFRSDFSSRHRQQDAAGKNRIEKTKRVADEEKPVPAAMLRMMGVFARDEVRTNLRAALEVIFDPDILFDLAFEDPFGRYLVE